MKLPYLATLRFTNPGEPDRVYEAWKDTLQLDWRNPMKWTQVYMIRESETRTSHIPLKDLRRLIRTGHCHVTESVSPDLGMTDDQLLAELGVTL